MSTARPPAPRRRFLRAGGWTPAVALILVSAAMLWRLGAMTGQRSRATGDGDDPASYGFTLEPAAVPAAEIVASGMPRDGLPALVDPPSMTAAEVDDANAARRGKLLLAGDLVAGVRLEGRARAYPLRFLVWHEVVNDTVGGEPIAVAHSPLSAATVAFRRRVGGEVRSFGVSGLLVDSGHLLYDRGAAESLWSPLLLRPVAGPAVGEGAVLDPLPVAVCSWAEWRAANPATTVLAPDPALRREYRRDPYSSYFGSDLLRFPVRPLPAHPTFALKEPLVAVRVDGALRAFPFLLVESKAGAAGVWTAEVGGVPLRFAVTARPRTVTVSSTVGELPTIYAAYFAWYAAHGGGSIVSDTGGPAPPFVVPPSPPVAHLHPLATKPTGVFRLR